MRGSWLEGARVDIMLNFVRTPHHEALLISSKAAIVDDYVRVSARAIAHVARILRIEGTSHSSFGS